MLSAIKGIPKLSPVARMIQFHDRTGWMMQENYYCALGWAYARGKGRYPYLWKGREDFASCAGELLFTERRSLMNWDILTKNILYLEDMDVGYRQDLWYETGMHLMPWYTMGSGTSGSRYNQFKIRYSSSNIYLIYKNMPVLQIIINLPFLVAGFGIKILFLQACAEGFEESILRN